MQNRGSAVLILLLVVGACSWPLSNDQKTELSKAVVRAHLDTVYSHYDEAPDSSYQRVILLKSPYLNARAAADLRSDLRPPFTGIRTDSVDVEYIRKSTQNSEGEPFQYIGKVRDLKTGLPVREIIVDSIRGTAPDRATLHLYEADHAGSHYQGLKWWMVHENGTWKPDSVRTIWIN